MNSAKWNSQILKYQRFTPSGCKAIDLKIVKILWERNEEMK